MERKNWDPWDVSFIVFSLSVIAEVSYWWKPLMLFHPPTSCISVQTDPTNLFSSEWTSRAKEIVLGLRYLSCILSTLVWPLILRMVLKHLQELFPSTEPGVNPDCHCLWSKYLPTLYTYTKQNKLPHLNTYDPLDCQAVPFSSLNIFYKESLLFQTWFSEIWAAYFEMIIKILIYTFLE